VVSSSEKVSISKIVSFSRTSSFATTSSSETTSSETTNRFIIGPAIGCEYYLGDNFSFGGEFALKYGSMKTVEDPEPFDYKDEKSYYFTTDSGLFIRFYL